jgi:hypothetical protein
MAPVAVVSGSGACVQACTVMTVKRIASNAIAIHAGFRKEDLMGIHQILFWMAGI